MMSRDVGWRHYLADFHEHRPGITETVLIHAEADDRMTPYTWVTEPLRDAEGPVLDLACGSAPTRSLLADQRWLGVDASARELAAAMVAGRGPVVRGRAHALPVADDGVAAVCAAMCLPVLTPLGAVLAELRRVLRPGGTIVALVPAQRGYGARGLLGWARVMRPLGLWGQPWPNPEARDGLARLLRTHGFVVDDDSRRVFRQRMADPADAALLVRALYLPGVPSARVDAATHALASWARPGRSLPLPLRRVVAHRPRRVGEP